MKKVIELNDLNYQEWEYEFVIGLETLSLQKHIKYENFNLYFLSLEKSELEKEYDRERASQPDEGERKRVDREWTKERRKFLSDKDVVKKKWNEGEEQTMGQIKKSISKSLAKEVKDCDTAYEMWEKLRGVGALNESTQAFNIFQTFLSLQYTSKSGSLSEYVNQHQELYDKLLSTKCALSEYCAAMKLLISLPPEYKHIVQILIQEKDLKLSSVKVVLMREESREKTEKILGKRETRVNEEREEEVFAAKINKPKGNNYNNNNNNNNNNNKRICSRPECKNIIHFKAPQKAVLCNECFFDEKNKNNKGKKAEVYNTSKKEKEKEKSEKSRRKKKVVNSSSSSDSSEVSSCLAEKEKIIVNNVRENRKRERRGRGKWYIDSACTSHLTNDKRQIRNERETNVRISGPLNNERSSKANIEGEVILEVKKGNNINTLELKKVICEENLKRNLMSVRKLTQDGLTVLFSEKDC
nr:hypothetical protein [Patescibacteria group bacterium]